MVSGFARYSAYIYNFNAKIENTTPETRQNIDFCNKQDKKASRDRPPPPSYICGRLPGGPGLRHQAQQDQVSGKQHDGNIKTLLLSTLKLYPLLRAESENILMYERDLIDMPGGLPSLSSIGETQLLECLVDKFNKNCVQQMY